MIDDLDPFVRAHAPEERSRECECPLEHDLAKLGHCQSCPHFTITGVPKFDVELSPGCPPRHADGTPHDFDWATYADDRYSFGVCECGHTNLSEAMWDEP